MGLFHETLKDAEEETRKNKYSHAKRALQTHMKEHHEAENEFHHLTALYEEYKQEIKNAHFYLSQLDSGKGSLEEKKEQRSMAIHHIQGALNIIPKINHFATEIKKMTKKLR